MKLKTLLLLFIIPATFISCDQITDNYWEKKEQENYTSPYMGKWVGSYQGNESGNLILSVAKSVNITGTYGPNNEMIISLVRDDGALNPMLSDTPIFLMYGSLIEKKGTWKNKDKQGSWTLTKQ